MISESTVDQIKAVAHIKDFCSTEKGYGQNRLFCKCPACGHYDAKKKEGLTIDTKKNTAHCFAKSCGVHYSGAIDFVMKTENLDYPAALVYVAKQYNIFIEETTEKPKPKAKKAKAVTPATPVIAVQTGHALSNVPIKLLPIDPQALANKITEKLKLKQAKADEKRSKTAKPETDNPDQETQKSLVPNGRKSFCDLQLSESGLTYEDIRIEITTDNGISGVSPFIQGTRDQFNNIIEHRYDDVLIRYYDLDGKPVMYKPEKTNILRPLVRVRWQIPNAHLDKDGNPIKYQSPAGSGSHIYIPEALRRMYKHGRKIKRLYLQEGEKKAEKSCKHGMMSVGLMGINNLGHESRLPDEIQLIVQRCEVEEVVFVLDSDWRNLSEKLENGKSVDTRPRQFFAAVRSFKEYLRTLANINLSVEIYFAYIKFNDFKAKGIDDLLISLPAPELVEGDFDFAVNDKQGAGKYVQVNKITMLPDDKIADFWLLNDADRFAEYHRKRLEGLKEFKIKGYLRKFNEKGVLEMAQQLFKEEQFWDEQVKTDREGNEKKTLIFDYVNAMNFLQRRGFWRIEMKSGARELIFIEKRVIKVIDHTEVKDYVKEFCREIKRNDVLNMLMRGGPQYLGPEKLSNLDINRPNIERATPNKQCLFFTDKIWEITAEGIKELNYGQLTEFVWNEKIIRHKVTALPVLLDVTPLTDELRPTLGEGFDGIETGEFFLDYTPAAAESHFMQFLINVSNFAHREKEDKITLAHQFMNSRHIVNKLTAIGYLLHDYKDDNESKAVIAMDAKLSEVGASNGRSGKSLIGVAISHVVPQVVVDGKDKNIDDDKFRYHEITEKIKNLFFDDVRANFDFESLFQVITGKMTVNQKSGLRFTMRREDTPKILITTNHAVNGRGSSFNDRQVFMAFTDYYNDTHKPVDDFGFPFFSEWDSVQWNLFFNLMATCLVMYFRSKQGGWAGSKRIGVVPPPIEDIEKRRLRQTMGENFLTWADAYFHWDEKLKTGNLNDRHVRKELFDNFLNENPLERKYCPANRFKEKVLAYCEYMGYDFNPKQRNNEGLDIMQYYPKLIERNNDGTTKTSVIRENQRIFIGRDDKTGGKEYFTLANKDFNETF